jgi:hypothetical protein
MSAVGSNECTLQYNSDKNQLAHIYRTYQKNQHLTFLKNDALLSFCVDIIFRYREQQKILMLFYGTVKRKKGAINIAPFLIF